MQKILFSGIILFISLTALCVFGKNDKSTLTTVGQKLPGFQAETLSGEQISTQSLIGKVVVVNFFATWCPPCREELPHLQQLWQTHKNDNFYVLAIGREHNASELKAFVNTQGYTFPVAADKKRKIYKKFAKEYIPRCYVIDQNGTIVYQTVGFTISEFNILTQKVNELLNK